VLLTIYYLLRAVCTQAERVIRIVDTLGMYPIAGGFTRASFHIPQIPRRIFDGLAGKTDRPGDWYVSQCRDRG